jgi:integrase/recombinase XerD
MNHSYKELNRHYTAWLDTLGFSDGVTGDYNNRVHEFLQWLTQQGVTHIHTLTAAHVKQYFTYLENRPNKRHKGRLLSVSFLNHNFIAVDKLLEFLHSQGLHHAPTPTGYRAPVDQNERIRKIEVLTQDQIKTLYNAIENTYPQLNYIRKEQNQYQLRLIFALYYACGLRLSEGAKLRLQDIDFERRTVFVEKGKNYKDRFVPMSAGAYRELQDYIYNFRNKAMSASGGKTPHNRLFLRSKNDLNKLLKDLQTVCNDEQIQAKRLSMHVLRHSIATHLLQNGMSIENISLFLGHSSLESTQIYTHILER